MDEIENKFKSFNFGCTSRLKDGIPLKDLVHNNAAEFTLDVSESIKDELDDFKLDLDDDIDNFDPFKNIIDSKEVLGDLSKIPFDELKEKMVDIVEDGEITKMVLRHGSGEHIPSDAVVYCHYNSFLEKQEIPFDSSYQRNQPLRIQLGIGALYPGFEHSLLSMKLSEQSLFLVSPKYGFGEMGCPPRIPPNATLLLEIELLKILDGEMISIDAPLEEKDSFSKVFSKAKEFHMLGNVLFAKEDVFPAVNKYKKAENILLSCKMCSDEEEALCRKLLFKIYVNMCVCYNHPKINSPERVCIAAREALYIHPEKAERSAKLYFHLGKAQLIFQNFKKARQYLNKALSLEPDNKQIKDLLIDLEKKMKKYYQHEKISYQKAFQSQTPPSKDIEPTIDFEKTFRMQLVDIIEKNIDKIQLPSSLTPNEKNLCRKISEEYGLHFEEIMIAGKRSVYVTTKEKKRVMKDVLT